MHSGHGYSPSKAERESSFGEESFAASASPSAFGRISQSTKRSVRNNRIGQSLRPQPGSLCQFTTHYSESTGPCYKPNHTLVERVAPRTKIGEERQRGNHASWSRDKSLTSTSEEVGPGTYEPGSALSRQITSTRKSCPRPKFGQNETGRNDPIEKKGGQGEYGSMPSAVGWQRRGGKKNAPNTKFGEQTRHFWIPKTGCF